MADPTKSQGRGAQNFPSSSNPRSPLSPGSGSGTPISFQTNVNRSKTKRWVEAKQYSYDGEDWGDEDEEEAEEAPPVPQAPYATHHTGSSSELSSRRLSSLALGADTRASVDKERNNSQGDQKPLPFVRPADLYKRMREEQAAQQAPSESGIPKADVASSSQTPIATAPSLGLPEVKRVSAFGTDFLGGASYSPPKDVQQDPSLHHTPSSGFRSVVQQAFDVPETPQSTTTSVARSNSDGTSTISPIIGGRNLTDDKTPTILEEPNESSPKAAATPPVFNPGHRRDLSLPGSNNSPSRKPQVTDLDTPIAAQGELSSASPQIPSSQPVDEADSPQDPTMQPYSSNGPDLPAPLKFGSASGPDGFHGEIPTIRGAEDSPQNADNDRLREEIIQSLSREATPSDDPEQSNQPQSKEPASSIPQQFEKYWNGQTSPPHEAPKAMVSEDHPDWTAPHPLASRDPYAQSTGVAGNSSTTIVDQPKKPKLERRFSWESSDEEEETEPQIPGSISSPPPLGSSLLMQEPGSSTGPLSSDALQEAPASDIEGADTQRVEKPRLSIVPPVPENITPPEQIMGPGTTPPPQPHVPSNVGTISLDESKLLGFRDILGITSINQRIKSFEHTRDQFASLDTGLSHWLQITIDENPEHAGLVQEGQNLPSNLQQPSPSRSRFPKLPFGTLGSLNDGTPTSATHMRRPSGHIATVMNREKVGEKGKEFLHTAGAFSGKASGAAKGLFAKGRSKFRPSGGPEKVQSTPNASRRSFQFSFPSASGDVSGNSSSLRNSVTLGSLPIFSSGRTEASPDPGPTSGDSCLDDPKYEGNARKRVKASEPGVIPQSHNMQGKSAVQPTQPSSSPEVPPKADDFNNSYSFEQELIAALRLSPTDPGSHNSAGPNVATTAYSCANGGKEQFAEPLPQMREIARGTQRVLEPPTEKTPSGDKSLPPIPGEASVIPAPNVNSQQYGPSNSAPTHIVTSSTVPTLGNGTSPPPPPPKDISNRLAPDENHRRQHSVSTLGPDEQTEGSLEDEANINSPSPLRETNNEVAREAQHNIQDEYVNNDNSAPSSNAFSSALPAVHKKRRSFMPFYPSEPTNSTHNSESRKRSISGLPQSVPDVQSPLRNEVRYSLGTRSSMLSFGSFGRHSNNKGSRPATPANDLSHASEAGSPAQNEESTIGKLKGFGRRRRASVSDLLTSIQGQGSQEPAAPQWKRPFSRISVLLGRQDSQDHEKNRTDHRRTGSMPIFTSVNGTKDAARDENPVLGNPFEQKPLPTRPPEPPVSLLPARDPEFLSSSTPRSTSISPQRASISLPPSSSSNSLSSGRFYSQLRSASMNETPTGSLHTTTLSPPLPGQSRSPSPVSFQQNRVAQPLSPLEELQDHQIQQLQKDEQGHDLQHPTDQGPQLGTLSENQEQEEHEEHKDRILGEQLRQKSTARAGSQSEPADQTPAFQHNAPNTANASAHPLREEDKVRIVNDSLRPVELAITADDSSEEIVMSPTSYPGQEWRPMYT